MIARTLIAVIARTVVVAFLVIWAVSYFGSQTHWQQLMDHLHLPASVWGVSMGTILGTIAVTTAVLLVLYTIQVVVALSMFVTTKREMDRW